MPGDLHDRCAAHGRWMDAHPAAVEFAEGWADANLQQLTELAAEPEDES